MESVRISSSYYLSRVNRGTAQAWLPLAPLSPRRKNEDGWILKTILQIASEGHFPPPYAIKSGLVIHGQLREHCPLALVPEAFLPGLTFLFISH